MILRKRLAIVAAATATLLALAGCASSASGGSGGSDDAASSASSGAGGEPVAGGTMRVLEQAQPTGFDPVQVFSSTSMPVTFTALYGQFLVPDTETGIYRCGLCESFTTQDGGATWEVVTREGLTFTDGTPFDAKAIKFNWDRMKDPALGSASAGIASQIDHIEIVDDVTAKLVMVVPNPGFMGLMPIYALQWIASPTALAKGTEEFNKNPIGAGPFVFQSWVPNGVVKLKKNPDYYDAPRPYLDGLEIQGVADNSQRLNSLISGGVDLIMNSDASIFAEGTGAGFVETNYTFNGGIGFMLNTSKPPFNDVRARNALAHALNLEQLSDAVTQGYPSVPVTLFTEDSPFYSDIPLQTYDAKKAQDLFDELAAEGTPVDFAFTVFPGTGQTVFDALQAQLNTYKNVTVTADQRDTSEQGVVGTTGDYQVLTSSLAFSDPSSRLWATLHGDAERTNYSRINEPALNDALDGAVAATEVKTQMEQWEIVQEQLAALDPYILYQQYFNGSLSTDKVNGLVIYGYTSPAAAGLWLQP